MKRLATSIALVLAITAVGHVFGQGFPNVMRTPGELVHGPFATQQGRTAIVAWHDEHIVSVPEPPGSQPGADLFIRVVNIEDPTNPIESIIPANAGGFNSHGYFKYGPYLYIGPHCLNASLGQCDGNGNIYRDSFLIGGVGPTLGTSSMTRASMEDDAGLRVGTYNRSGAQSPWGAEMFWSYSEVSGNAWLGNRRAPGDWVHDWNNGGAPTGPGVKATWDHLGETGVIGFPFIMGNILIYAADQTGTGVATYDISDPSNPILLDVLKEENPGGYWPEIYGHYIFFPRRDGEGGAGSAAGFMVVDFSDPTDLQVVADKNLEGSNQYVTFQDEFAFMNNYKIDMRTFEPVLELATNDTTLDASQFALPVGNLVITGGYGSLGPGLAIWAHQAEPDTRSPFVAYHVPGVDQANYSTVCPISISIPETLKTETIIDGDSLIVRPVGGMAVPTWHSFSQGKILTVTPQDELIENTTYEVILTSDIQDAAGNGLEPYTFRFSTGSNVSGGNQPPVVESISANPATGEPNQQIDFSWTGSDADMDSLEYRIDFGDGSPRTAWSASLAASHTYTEEGHYRVTVQVRDPQSALSARSRTVTVVAPPAAAGSTASSLLAHDSGSGIVYKVNPDNDTITAFDSSSLTVLWETPVDAHPSGVALADDGTVWVVCRNSDSIAVLNAGNGALIDTIDLAYGVRPVAIAPVPGNAELLVSCEGDGTLRRFSAASRMQTDSVELGPFPRAIAVTHDGARALVTRFISPEHTGQVFDVSLSGPMTLTRTINLNRDRTTDGSASGRGVPNYLAGISISPNGEHAWVVGKKDNTTRGTFFSNQLPLGQDNTVRAQLMVIDLTANAEDTSLRLDIDNSDSPSAITFSPLGDYAFIALQGNAQIAVIDVLEFMDQSSPGVVHSRWGTGLAPQGVILDEANNRLFSADLMGRSATALDIATFLDSGMASVVANTIDTVGEERFHSSVLTGKQHFYNASDPRMSAEGYISCATCHIDGSHDGRTFDFTNRGEGFRNTTDLRGRSGTWHGAVHWSANFDEIQDFENDIRGGFGGTGFLDDGDFVSVSPPLGDAKTGLNSDLDALSDYVTSLGVTSVPRSPYRNSDSTLSEAAVRGQLVFNTNNCASCHNPATDFTDRMQHDVGTLKASSGSRLGEALLAIDTPTLLGVHAAAPYFHDGSAATLEDVFTIAGGTLLQGEGASMSGSVAAEDVGWLNMKEWHQSAFAGFNGAGTITFSNVSSSVAGTGYLVVRYNSAYGNTPVDINVNGNVDSELFPITPNEPGWMPNEWRSLQFEVEFQAGMNTVSFSRGAGGGQLKIDDVLFITPDDLAAADAHVRPFMGTELEDLVAYLNSLDGQDAGQPQIAVMRDGVVSPGMTDVVSFPGDQSMIQLTYTIANNGGGPLNLGQMRLDDPGTSLSISQYPAPNVLPGETTDIVIDVPDSAVGETVEVYGWTDDSLIPQNRMSWSIEVIPAGSSGVGDAFILF